MEYLLFAVYLIILCWLITKVPFIKHSGINNKYIIILFLFKIIAGLAIGWISYNMYSTGNDYWDVNREGWKEYQLLWTDPKEYFTNIFKSQYSRGYGGLFDSFQSFWNDLRNNIIIKFLSVCNFLSRGNYYINSLFFNFFCFMGHVAFYRVFIQIFNKQQAAVICCCFLLPSMLYFTSGVQKDGIVFTILGFLSYAVFQSLQQKKIIIKYLVIIVISLAALFLIRSYVLLNLLPALFIWVIVSLFKWPPLKSFIVGYLVLAIAFFNIGKITTGFDPMKIVSQKQADFFTLPVAATQIKLDTLAPDFKSFISNVPQALNHLLLRPYPNELQSKNLLPIIIELMLYHFVFIFFLFFKRKNTFRQTHPFILFGLFFTFSMYLFIGYIMPNLGSLVRYRSVYLPFLITPVLCMIDWQKLQKICKIKK